MASGTVENCAAAVYVEGSSTAGGVIGTMAAGTTVKNSYSGGHTIGGNFDINEPGGDLASGRFNVISLIHIFFYF